MKTKTTILKHGKDWAAKNIGKTDCPECGNGSRWLHSYEKATLNGTFSASQFKCDACKCVFETAKRK